MINKMIKTVSKNAGNDVTRSVKLMLPVTGCTVPVPLNPGPAPGMELYESLY